MSKHMQLCTNKAMTIVRYFVIIVYLSVASSGNRLIGTPPFYNFVFATQYLAHVVGISHPINGRFSFF